MPDDFTDIGKEEAARRSIDLAVELHFADADAVGIHVLASAGLGVASAICRHKGLPTAEDGRLLALIKPEHHSTVRQRFREPYNFFKHADRDPDRILSFHEELNDFQLFFAGIDFQTAFGTITRPMVTERAWFFWCSPQFLADEAPREAINFAFGRPSDGLDRRELKAAGARLLRGMRSFPELDRWFASAPQGQ